MNAEEFKDVLDKLDDTIENIGHKSFESHTVVGDLHTLRQVLYELNQHRLEMEAPEAKPLPRWRPTVTLPDFTLRRICEDAELTDRIDAIEKRLDEIEEKHGNLNKYYEVHMRNCHTGDRRPKRPSQPPPAPAIGIEMRVKATASSHWRWESLIGHLWINPLEFYVEFVTPDEARMAGKAWLADLGEMFGVKLVPKWITDKQAADAG